MSGLCARRCSATAVRRLTTFLWTKGAVAVAGSTLALTGHSDGMTDEQSLGPPDPPMSVLASRLAVDDGGQPPTQADLGLGAAQRVGFDWQQQRSHGRLNEIFAAMGTGASDWVRKIHGIFGVIGEQVLVATEAEVEKAISAERLAALHADADPPRAALSRSAVLRRGPGERAGRRGPRAGEPYRADAGAGPGVRRLPSQAGPDLGHGLHPEV